MTKIKRMTYTKDSGEVSEREVIIVASPRDKYLVYDVTKLTEAEKGWLLKYMKEIDTYRDETFEELKSITGIRQNALWRSFKPEGIEWETENEIQTTE